MCSACLFCFMGLKACPFLNEIYTHTQHHSTWKVALYKIFKLRSDSDLFYAQYCMGILPINYVVDPRKLSFLSKQRTHPLSTVDIISLIFVSNPQLYCIVRVVTSIVRTDHKTHLDGSENCTQVFWVPSR